MGNIGRPSFGCALCRKRRVKCDETYPSCNNCTRLKKQCPGYPKHELDRFRYTIFVGPDGKPTQELPLPENPVFSSWDPNIASVTESNEEERSKSSNMCSDRTSDSTTNIKAEKQDSPGMLSDRPRRSQSNRYQQAPQNFNMLSPLRNNFKEQVVWYSLSLLDAGSRQLYKNNTFTFLPDIIEEAGEKSCVYAAMTSVGTMNLVTRVGPSSDLVRIANAAYARALSLVNAALSDQKSHLTDETLVAVWLLAIREIIEGIAKHPYDMFVASSRFASKNRVHIDGILMLLQLRGEEQFLTSRGRHLYQTLLSSMHWRNIFLCEEPTEQYLLLERQLSKVQKSVPVASIKLMSFFHEVTRLRVMIKPFIIGANPISIQDLDTIEKFLSDADRLHSDIVGWCDIDQWLPRNVNLNLICVSNDESSVADQIYFRYYFDTFAGFFSWNRYYVAKILLYTAVIDVLSLMAESKFPVPNSQGGSEEAKIILPEQIQLLQEFVQQFLGLIAYAFGDVNQEGEVHWPVSPSSSSYDQQRCCNIPATLQLIWPLAFLQHLKYLTIEQQRAMRRALYLTREKLCIG